MAASPSQATLALAAVGAVVLAMLTARGILHDGRGQLLSLLVCLPVLATRRWPLAVLAVVTVAAGLVAATGHASLLLGVLVGLALYFSALDLPRTRSITLVAAVATALGVAVLYAAVTAAYTQVAAEVVENFVPLAGAWFIADSVTTRRRYQAGLAAQAERERAAEVREERVRIAREMHDVVAHALAVMTVQAGVGRCLAGNHPDAASVTFGSIETIGRTAQDELRVVLGLLRDGESGGAELVPAPGLTDIEDLVGTVRASGVPVDLRIEGTDRRFAPSLELSVYRVVQEALTNVVKHAPGARVVVELIISAGKVRLDVSDDGAPGGAHVPRVGPDAGHGITGMRERIVAFGGWLVAGPVADGGFRVTAEVPLESVAS